MAKGSWEAGGWNPRLFEACLSRSHMLAQGAENIGAYTHRYPTDEQVRELVADPISYRITYKDGLRATMLLMNGLVGDFNFAAKLKGQERVVSTLLYLDSGGTNAHNVQCKSQDIAGRLCAILQPISAISLRADSSILMSGAEKMFLSGKALYPVRLPISPGEEAHPHRARGGVAGRADASQRRNDGGRLPEPERRRRGRDHQRRGDRDAAHERRELHGGAGVDLRRARGARLRRQRALTCATAVFE